jgi:hypothetical protein
MDAYHPWTKYEVARMRDEERLLRARDAMHLRELRESQEETGAPSSASGWFDRLRRRAPVTDQASARARPA